MVASAVGVTSLALPSAVSAASDPSASAVAAWSDAATLTFSGASTQGFTVTWTPAA